MALKKESAFDPQKQQTNTDSKIIVALEKVSEVFRVLQWNEAQEHKISPIQLQILVFINYHALEQCKVSYLSREFNITKATISDSVKTLLKKNLVTKTADKTDARSFALKLTKEGEKLANRVKHYTNEIKMPLMELNPSKKESLLDSLTELIYKLQSNGIISIQRMCYSCSHYEGNKSDSHYCNLLQEKLNHQELRMDCPEHIEIVK